LSYTGLVPTARLERATVDSQDRRSHR